MAQQPKARDISGPGAAVPLQDLGSSSAADLHALQTAAHPAAPGLTLHPTETGQQQQQYRRAPSGGHHVTLRGGPCDPLQSISQAGTQLVCMHIMKTKPGSCAEQVELLEVWQPGGTFMAAARMVPVPNGLVRIRA